MSGLDLWHFLLPVRVMAYGAAGAVGTRLSLRPLFSLRRTVSCITRARTCREKAEVRVFCCLTIEPDVDGNQANVLVVTGHVPVTSIRDAVLAQARWPGRSPAMTNAS